ncbi:FixJ family two-component response regulator [Skermanella aerolata]|uniref:response regulator transcription factor n=1 Tax=Skermanella aerolata TaxID=393310 RepID=UPI003D1E7305
MIAFEISQALIHLVDDDGMVLRALKRLLSAAGYRSMSYGSAEEFLARPNPDGPGCAVVDLCLPGEDGLNLQSKLMETGIGLPLIFLTGRGDIASTVRAMKGGAVDFLTKPVEKEALLAAVSKALELDFLARAARVDIESFECNLALLTPREREVLEGVVAGRLNKQIAADLNIAEKTIKVHRARVMQKMNVRTTADLVRLVVMHGS